MHAENMGLVQRLTRLAVVSITLRRIVPCRHRVKAHDALKWDTDCVRSVQDDLYKMMVHDQDRTCCIPTR